MSLKEILDLGKQPIANGFLASDEFSKEKFYDLRVGFDEETQQLSLIETPEKTDMFNDSYVYRSSGSKTMLNHFKQLKEKLERDIVFDSGGLARNFPDKETLRLMKSDALKILEIGSNDGAFISNFGTDNTVCVEPCANFARITKKFGYTTYTEFWTKELSDKIKDKHGTQHIIYSSNCMCHIPEIDEAFQAVSSLLKEDGIFIFEDPNLESVIDNLSVDQIYDEHAHVFSSYFIHQALEKVGMQIWKRETLGNIHGGSTRFYVIKNNSKIGKLLGVVRPEERYRSYSTKDLEDWSESVKQNLKNLKQELIKFKNKGKHVIAIGATSKSTTIFNYSGIDRSLITYITDSTPEKQGKFSPGMHIPVISPEVGLNKNVDAVFLSAWNFKDEIIKNYSHLLKKDVQYITHVPQTNVFYA